MSSISSLIFDLDNTLYPSNSGLLEALSGRIISFMEKNLSLSYESANKLRMKYLSEYGTTIAGLVRHDGVDPHEYAVYISDMDYSKYIKQDPALEKTLSQLNHKKIIFTNSSHIHTIKVLSELGLENLFDRIIAIEDMEYHSKPMHHGYVRMIELSGIDPTHGLFFDDTEVNLIAASKFGIKTVHIDGESNYANITLNKLTDFTPDLLKLL